MTGTLPVKENIFDALIAGQKFALADESGDPTTPVSIYKVGALARPQLRFKVSVNAQENHMTGVGLACEQGDFALVVVEGPPGATQVRAGGV